MEIETAKEDGIYNLYIDNKYIGLGKVSKGQLKRFIILYRRHLIAKSSGDHWSP
jgi:hypothetical protein